MLSKLMLMQICAIFMDGEPFSHACAAARAMDYGLKHLYQVGIGAFSKQEYNE